MRVKKPEFIISIILILSTAFMLYQTSIMSATVVPNELGPRFFPYICLIAMAILSFLLLFSSFKVTTDQGEKSEYSIKEAVFFFFLIFISIIAVYIFGFLIGMIIGVAVILCLIGWKVPKAALFSVLSVAAVMFVFQTLIGIPLYKGILF